MTHATASHELSAVEIGGLTAEIRLRKPRQEAASDIEISSIPMRTCYETMTRLNGPVDSVLDYAAWLFSEDKSTKPGPTPPLTIEEAHTDFSTGIMTLVLSRGSFTAK